MRELPMWVSAGYTVVIIAITHVLAGSASQTMDVAAYWAVIMTWMVAAVALYVAASFKWGK